jgi:hypothetical protein
MCHLGFMSFDKDDAHERVWRALNSEVPCRTSAHGLIARAEGCVAWVEAVDLFSTVLRFKTCLIVTPERAAKTGAPYFSFHDDPPDANGAAAVETLVDLGAHQFSQADGTLHSTGGSASSSGISHVDFWLPFIPSEQLAVRVRASMLDLDGIIKFDASTWPSMTRPILSL